MTCVSPYFFICLYILMSLIFILLFDRGVALEVKYKIKRIYDYNQ